jgi:hypothetical protein
MRKIAFPAAVFAALAFAGTATAHDDVLPLSIPDALAIPAAQQKLDGSVKFYFGKSDHPAVLSDIGQTAVDAHTNANKGDFEACSWVFLSALIHLQQNAHKAGANAVINIDSYYKEEDVSSETTVPCHKGYIVAAISLKGELVKIP